jgi:hypothetical protein
MRKAFVLTFVVALAPRPYGGMNRQISQVLVGADLNRPPRPETSSAAAASNQAPATPVSGGSFL